MNNKLFDIIKSATIFASSPSEISQTQLNTILKKYKFAIIKGLISETSILKAKSLIKKQFSAINDNPATGESPTDIMDNFQKLSIGGAEHSGTYRPRCMRTFYNPLWADNIYEMKEIFRIASQTRNILYGWDLNYCIDQIEDGFWTAARIHNYPSGGGFLVSHIDDVVPVVQKKEGINSYFQPVVVMSKKGTKDDCDFETGGGFFEVLGERYYYEENANLGDIYIYSGSTTHGVADIDLHKTFNSNKCDGRFAAFVTLYKQFNRIKQLEDYIGKAKTKY